MIMRSMLAGLSVAGLLVAAAPAFASNSGASENGSAPTPGVMKLDLRKGETVAMLAKPLKSPKDPVINGRIWHCEGDTCRVGEFDSARAVALVRDCSDGARSVGAFTSFQTGNEVLATDSLAKCNTSAR